MFGVYIHVPFCSSRCGYCDFNTYTPGELGTSASPETYLDALEQELELAEFKRPADTIFIGGGTPSLLGAQGLRRILTAIRNTFGINPGAEITTESNPESTSPEFFAELRDAGFTRISLGMQSASAHVLQVLERRHTPGRAFAAVAEARAAGFAHINLDMIYGTPTETDADVQATVEQVIASGVDHVSAYSLIVEDGTRMARKVRRGELPAPDEDVYADRYALIDAALVAAGYPRDGGGPPRPVVCPPRCPIRVSVPSGSCLTRASRDGRPAGGGPAPARSIRWSRPSVARRS